MADNDRDRLLRALSPWMSPVGVVRIRATDLLDLVENVRSPEAELRLHVSTHPDMETRVTLLNEGYALAMAQHLADDPTTAQDWLDKHDDDTRRDQAERDVKIIEGILPSNEAALFIIRGAIRNKVRGE